MGEPGKCHGTSSPPSPAAAGKGSGGSGRRRRKAAAALGSHGALQKVWTSGSRGCSQITANPSPAGPSCSPPALPSTHPSHQRPNATRPTGLSSLFPTQPSPTLGSIQPCEPQAAAAKPFVPRPSRELRASLLCSVSLIATTTCAFPIPVPWVPPAPMSLAAHIWKGFSRALKETLLKARLAATRVTDLTLSTPSPHSHLPRVGQNCPHPVPCMASNLH